MVRVISVSVPKDDSEALHALLEEQELLCSWPIGESGELRVVEILVKTERAEPLLDLLEHRFGRAEGFRAIVLKVHATVPSLPADEEPASGESAPKEPEEPVPQRVARAEMQSELENGIDVGPVFLATVVLSAIIAAIGLMRDNVAIIIGAMVVAPLLKPNMALAFSVTVGDLELGRKALRAASIGVVVALLFSVILGLTIGFTVGSEIEGRTQPHPSDLLLALASGAAGALAFTSGVSASLVGVMVAVALLPPTVVCGLMASKLDWGQAGGALLLLSINAICVVLAGVATFRWRGVRPRTWWEKAKAKKYTQRMIVLCSALALALFALVVLANRTYR